MMRSASSRPARIGWRLPVRGRFPGAGRSSACARRSRRRRTRRTDRPGRNRRGARPIRRRARFRRWPRGRRRAPRNRGSGRTGASESAAILGRISTLNAIDVAPRRAVGRAPSRTGCAPRSAPGNSPACGLPLSARLLAAVILGGLLRIDHAHARQRSLVPQIALVAVVPAVNLFHHGQPAPVVERAGEFGEPGTQPVGDAVERPEPDFRRRSAPNPSSGKAPPRPR